MFCVVQTEETASRYGR